MRYAIVESGGKQYKAVEGQVIEVDRLAAEEGKEINLERVLLLADGDRFQVGAPTLGEVEVKATVVGHISGPKVARFKYSPKKRIRVRGGHRQQYTRLMIDFVGGKGEERRRPTAEPTPVSEPEAKPAIPEEPKKARAMKTATKKTAGSKTAAKKTGK